MMETARDLNMETDEMQLVVSALRGVGKRIVEVADTHKPLFAGELFLAGKILYKASDLEKMLEENYKSSRTG